MSRQPLQLQQPRIAILIPAFNAANTIEATLATLFTQGQALSRISVVCVADDGSRDNTVHIAESVWASFQASVPMHVLRASQNRGERANCNGAIEWLRARVDWLLILHADDLAQPDWLRLILDQIESCGPRVASICSSWIELMENGCELPGEDDPDRAPEIIEGSPASVQRTLVIGCWWHISGAALRMEAIGDVGDFHPEMPQLGDWQWILRCLWKEWSIVYIPRSLIKYRQHVANVSTASFKRDADIRESLVILRQFATVLTVKEIERFHRQRIWWALRRAGVAVARRRPRRAFVALGTVVEVANSWRVYRPQVVT